METSLRETRTDMTEYESLQPKSPLFLVLYFLANTVIGLGNITFFTVLLPLKMLEVAPGNPTASFSLLSGCGAAAALLTNPVIGACSDRTTSALGRRLPWIMVGMITLLPAMVLLASAPSLLLVGIGTVLLQIAINIMLAALSALLPDQIPLQQRATVSALAGMAPLVGGLLGQILVEQVIHTLSTSFLDLALLSLALLLLFCLVLQEQHLPREAVAPFRLAHLLSALRPFTRREFALIWGARCLVFLTTTTVINYLFSFLQAEHLFIGKQVTAGVQLFYTIYVGTILVSSLVCGKLSDLLQRRKPFVIGASLVIATGVALLAVIPVLPVVMAAAVVIGSGFGAYLSADLALASQILPEAQSRGKDLGWMNSAIFVPMLLAPLLAGMALSLFHSYVLLFTVLIAGSLGAAALILPVKAVR